MIISGRVVSNNAHTDHFLSSILEELTYSKTRCLWTVDNKYQLYNVNTLNNICSLKTSAYY